MERKEILGTLECPKNDFRVPFYPDSPGRKGVAEGFGMPSKKVLGFRRKEGKKIPVLVITKP
jgi:hypothetical protein